MIPRALYGGLLALFLYLDFLVYQSGHPVLGVALLAVIGLFAYVYAHPRAYAYRYMFPSLLGFGLFVILPLIYTIHVSFTNYSGTNLLSFDDVKEYFARETTVDANRSYPLKVYPGGRENEWIVSIEQPAEPGGAPSWLVSKSFASPVAAPLELEAAPGPQPAGTPLTVPQVIKIRDSIKNLTITDPASGVSLRMNSFSSFAPTVKLWEFNEEDDSFKNTSTGEIIKPNHRIGFYVGAQSQTVGPGFRTGIGLRNYTQIFTNQSVREPFLIVFVWTLVFAFLSVVLTFIVGFLLAVLLEWEAIKGRKIWRSLVILPYAVPAFISILIFRGLFNPQFGDINAFLNMMFGVRPDWMTDPFWARTMVLIVNLWLGYPYMMILSTGILQSVPKDIYEASSIDGGSAASDLYRMTLPMILPPLKPLLIASFAFNFNNFLLIQLLTAGGPQIVGASTAVGYTDILVTYTFNLAFRNAGANYGFAGAIATIIFIIVSILSYVNLKAATRNDQKNRG